MFSSGDARGMLEYVRGRQGEVVRERGLVPALGRDFSGVYLSRRLAGASRRCMRFIRGGRRCG